MDKDSIDIRSDIKTYQLNHQRQRKVSAENIPAPTI